MPELDDTLEDGEVNAVWVGNKYKRGFDRNDPDSMGECSYDEATRTFTIEPKSGQTDFSFMVMGSKVTKTTAQTIVWDNTTNTYYFYFDTDGVLQSIDYVNMRGSTFLLSAICGLVYWNAVTQKAIIQCADEMHGVSAEAYWHMNHHITDGAEWSHGLDPTGLVDASSTYTNLSLGISMDEDIAHTTLSTTTHPFIWREGAAGGWVQGTANNEIADMGTSYAYWNEWTGTVWQKTESASSTDYIIYFFLWTNDEAHPVKKIVGQAAYPSRGAARTALRDELTAIALDGLPSTEAYFLYAYIAKRDGDLEDDGEGNPYVDLRVPKGFNLQD